MVDDEEGTEPVFPELQGAALIRELHVYGQLVATGATKDANGSQVDDGGSASQHQGFGRRLLAEAEVMARRRGYTRLAVISGVGTRQYYRKHGYEIAPGPGLTLTPTPTLTLTPTPTPTLTLTLTLTRSGRLHGQAPAWSRAVAVEPAADAARSHICGAALAQQHAPRAAPRPAPPAAARGSRGVRRGQGPGGPTSTRGGGALAGESARSRALAREFARASPVARRGDGGPLSPQSPWLSSSALLLSAPLGPLGCLAPLVLRAHDGEAPPRSDHVPQAAGNRGGTAL
eukprot:scaffold104722_cov61-Phaeocystis_antarctica.AAC.2